MPGNSCVIDGLNLLVTSPFPSIRLLDQEDRGVTGTGARDSESQS